MTRIRSRKRKTSRWHRRQSRDRHVREANRLGLRSRSYFKLVEIDDRFKLFKAGQRVLDLGASPGGWSQYAASRTVPGGMVCAIDLLPMDPIANVQFIQCDITRPEGFERVRAAMRRRSAGVVLSDMAPNLTGNSSTDEANFERLHEAIFRLSECVLQPGGALVFKIFNDSQSALLKRRCLQLFGRCELFKPNSSRSRSKEMYMIAMRYHGPSCGAAVDG